MSAIGPIDIDPTFVPRTAGDWEACLSSPRWRIFSGHLYKIMVKTEGAEGEGHVLPFIPNGAQTEFINALHFRNVCLKARQLGFTTAIAILWLDHALFVPDQRVGIIAHSLDDAASIFRDKVKFAYNNLPDPIRERMPLARDSAKELLFGHNNSAIRVATSMRSGTIHRLHISEMGKIAAKYPEKAKEIVTGSLPAVPLDGVAIIESTAEGRAGEFYEIARRAEELAQMGRPLAQTEWKFHFFPWWRDPAYSLDPTRVIITEPDAVYFANLQAKAGVRLTAGQKAWYVSKRENDFSGDPAKMWQEMPSTSEECWQKSTEGTYFAPQLAAARVQGRIGIYPHVEGIRVNTFWDIGAGDGTGIWLHQHVQGQHRFIAYIEDWAKGYAHYVRILRETKYIFGGMYLPHDAAQVRQLVDTVAAPFTMLQGLAPDWDWRIVPRVDDLQHGFELTRQKFAEAFFHEADCKIGLDHLGSYHKKFNTRLQMFVEEPEKQDGHSECADAFRQWAQGWNPSLTPSNGRQPRRASGMTA